ncbi:hypothetical protein D3C85_907590 [compost metagenome]
MIDSRQQVIRGDAAGVAAHRLPVGRVAPTLIETFQRFFIGSRLVCERQGSGGFGQQAAVAGQFHVQALGQIAQGLILASLGEVFGRCFINRFSGQAAAVPTGDGSHGARHAADHFRVANAFVEQRHDWHQEHQQQKQHQRRDQRLGLPAVDPLGVLEPLLQGGAGALVQGNGDSHDVLRESLIVTEAENHLCCVETPQSVGASLLAMRPSHSTSMLIDPPLSRASSLLQRKPAVRSYLAAQELKRCSSCSPLSAQKLTSICTWLAMFSGVVGMSFRTSLASNGTAWVLAGP